MDDLIKALVLWYLVILAAIPVVIAPIPLLFSLRRVVLIAALLLSMGCAYTIVVSVQFISWGFDIGWVLYSTYGPGLVAYAVCYALSAGFLFVAIRNPGKGILLSP